MGIDFDDVLPDIGEFGLYQKLLVWFVFLPGFVPCGFHAYSQVFMASLGTGEYFCKNDELLNAQRHSNWTSDQIKTISIPTESRNDQSVYARCSMYDHNYTAVSQLVSQNVSWDKIQNLWNNQSAIIPCQDGWHFNLAEHQTSIVAEWELVCERDFFPTMALVVFAAGGLVGNWIFGYLQDSLGRKPSFFIFLFIECVFGIATALAPNFWTWLAFRVGVGFTIPAIMGTPFVLAIEMVGPNWRTHVSIISNIAYSLCLVTVSAIFWFIRDWRQLSLATTVPFMAFFFYWWVMPESPRWLLANNRFDEAEKIIRKMARVNGKYLAPDYLTLLRRKQQIEEEIEGKESPKSPVSYGMLDLFKSPNLARKTVFITFIWFTVTSVYVGLSYYAPNLGGDEYFNFFIAAVAELPTYLFLWPSMDRWGRRWTLCTSMLIGGIACILTVNFQEDRISTLVLYGTGKFGVSAAFVVLPLMASELYPTVVRGIGLSISGVAGTLGAVYIPLVNYMGTEYMALPLVTMGALMVAGGIVALLLPETLHQPLPETLAEGEAFGKHLTYRDWFTCCPPPKPDDDLQSSKQESLQDSPLRSLREAQALITPKEEAALISVV